MTTTREVEFRFDYERSDDSGDGRTLRGYAAVFNSPTDIRDQDGEYTEIVAPGAFRRTLQRQTPVLMFNHGKHPLIGDMPLGKITDIREDPRGLYVEARLSDNWLVQPVRDAIADGAVSGMSFRFEVVKDDWSAARGRRTRTLKEVKAPELGPVVNPAYRDTAVSVRSALTALQEQVPEVRVTIDAGETRDDDAVITTWDPDIRQMLGDAIEDLWGLADVNSDAYIIDLYEGQASFTVKGRDNSKYPGLWIVDYTFADGAVTIGAPAKAQATVIPTGVAGNQTPANMSGGMNAAEIDGEERTTDTSEELATDRGTSEELVDTNRGEAVLTPTERIRQARLEAAGIL